MNQAASQLATLRDYQGPRPHISCGHFSWTLGIKHWTFTQIFLHWSFHFPPPACSTKSASVSSFYQQTAAPNQQNFSKAISQLTVSSTSLPLLHHGSQVCCCLDILLYCNCTCIFKVGLVFLLCILFCLSCLLQNEILPRNRPFKNFTRI